MGKQAVLLIHGIGNQRPMQTLRAFVHAAWTTHNSIHTKHAGGQIWSKPDDISDTYELRKLTTPENVNGIRTDFYEFYWQHLLQGTKINHVVGWAKTLLLRSPGSVPPGLVLAYWTLWLLIIVGVGLTLYFSLMPKETTVSTWWTVAKIVGGFSLLPIASFILTEIVGDAARYLHPDPANIQCRHKIRSLGVSLIKELHNRNYDRIILVGHSLGSIIGYDVLTHSWPYFNIPTQAKGAATSALTELEALAVSIGKGNRDQDVQRIQRAYFNELKEVGGHWGVTDFITLGSPLAHAAILMAQEISELQQKQKDREYPKCLPTLETFEKVGGTSEQHFTYGPQTKKTNGYHLPIPHHAAVFGPTRWSNLYFPCRFLIFGDLIGGPLREVFGLGIRDIPVSTSDNFGFLTHTKYWSIKGDLNPSNSVQDLRTVLDLPDNGNQK